MLFQRIETLTGAKNLKNAKRKQYEHYEAFTLLKKNGDTWDSVAKSNPTLLCKKIGFALFGLPPPQLADSNENNMSLVSTSGSYELKIVSLQNLKNQKDRNHLCKVQSGYSNDQDKQIASIGNVIISRSTGYEIKFSCVFVTFQEDSTIIEGIPKVTSVPLFRIQSGGSNIVYIDTNCRVYESWADFLTTNTLPDIVICYPLHGSYDIKTGFSVGFSKTPASSAKSKALKAADKVEKVISVGAGVAGVAALVVSAPVLAPCAVVGGAAAGIYGFGRCVVKILDKKKHNEPYAKEVVKGAFNVIAVAAAGALRVAEGAVVVSTKIAQGICGLNGFVGLLYSGNTTKLIELLNELCDQSSMISFYFNVASSSEAIDLIKKTLEINERADDVEVLETLVKIKSIEYSDDKEDVTKLEKYVSENITDLVISLLKTINPIVKDVAILLTGINKDFQSLKDKRPTDVFDQIDSKMSKLLANLLIENKDIGRIFLDLACRSRSNKSLNSRVSEQFLSEITNARNEHLLLRLRDLIWSVLSKVREVNQYCNNIVHQPNSLISFDVKFHPVEEVNRKIRDIVEQNQSTNELHSKIVLRFDDFLQQILEFLLKHAQPCWTLTQFTECLSLITHDIKQMFDEEIKQLKTIVQNKKKPTCNDLNKIFEESGIKRNYGRELLQKVLDCYEVDQWNIAVMSQSLTRVPAWTGMTDNLYCYCSNGRIQPEDILQVYRTNIHLYNKEESSSGNLVCLRPLDDDLPLPTYFIYSASNHEDMKHGLVWVSPNTSN
ncbi:hypothetical protein J6590_070842 [Homalodisca vitripennis]|nr:hypothetical protein J6590_070842 [Homalodisca vitripennis]